MPSDAMPDMSTIDKLPLRRVIICQKSRNLFTSPNGEGGYETCTMAQPRHEFAVDKYGNWSHSENGISAPAMTSLESA